MTRRQEKVASQLRRLLADAIQHRLSDPRIPAITSITRIDVSPDFEVAHIYVSPLDTQVRRELCVEALNNAAGRLRRMIRPALTLRIIPQLVFRLDDSVRKACETVETIERVMRDAAERAGAAADADSDAAPDHATDSSASEPALPPGTPAKEDQ